MILSNNMYITKKHRFLE